MASLGRNELPFADREAVGVRLPRGTRRRRSTGDSSLSSEQANFNGDYPYGRAPKGPYLGRTSQWDRTSRTTGACTTCTATCGNGVIRGSTSARAPRRPRLHRFRPCVAWRLVEQQRGQCAFGVSQQQPTGELEQQRGFSRGQGSFSDFRVRIRWFTDGRSEGRCHLMLPPRRARDQCSRVGTQVSAE